MLKVLSYIACIFLTTQLKASPIVPMNKAFSSLIELIPYLTDKPKFVEKKNEAFIQEKLMAMSEAFKAANHEALLKQDLFAPSLTMVRENLKNSSEAFKAGNKDYALWRMKEITTQCMDCHTRLPANHPSSFREGKWIDKSKFSDRYNFGIAQLIARLYPEAKATFTQVVDEAIVKDQIQNVMLPLKQILLIQTKILKEPAAMVTVLKHYQTKKELLEADKALITQWTERLNHWKNSPHLKPLQEDQQATEFMTKVMKPLFKNDSLYVGKFDVDLLIASGLLSNFLFENPQSKLAPDTIYWLGLSEKYLKREDYFGAGELFLKECIIRYPESKIATKCYDEYKESIEFEFTGSRGTDIPKEIDQELESLKKLIDSKKSKKPRGASAR